MESGKEVLDEWSHILSRASSSSLVNRCCGGAARAKAMLVDRLTVAEDRLMVLSHQDTMEDLVQAKLRLAQADYVLLEKQVCIEECMRHKGLLQCSGCLPSLCFTCRYPP